MNDSLTGIVVSSRVRFARNLRGYRFPSAFRDKNEATEIINKSFRMLEKFGKFRYLKMSDADPTFAGSLKERYVISEALLKSRYGAVAYSESGDLSVMINEEDHLREQYLVRGSDLAGAFSKLARLDDWLNLTLNFCKNERLGYVTACPTNLGTGMRASLMTFLPGHTKLGRMDELTDRAAELDLTVRGAFGEGSGGDSYLYQISNEVTLGKSENGIIKSVKSFVEEVAAEELELQRVYYRSDETAIEDAIFRSLGALLYCRKISYAEFSSALSDVKLGVLLGFIKVRSVEALDDLLVCARPCYLSELCKARMSDNSPAVRDVLRAEFIREKLGTLVID